MTTNQNTAAFRFLCGNLKCKEKSYYEWRIGGRSGKFYNKIHNYKLSPLFHSLFFSRKITSAKLLVGIISNCSFSQSCEKQIPRKHLVLRKINSFLSGNIRNKTCLNRIQKLTIIETDFNFRSSICIDNLLRGFALKIFLYRVNFIDKCWALQ